MNEQAPKIRLVTNNTYGEFNFYTTRENLQEYLDETLKITVDQFLEGNSLEGNRHYFNWIKARSNKKTDGNLSGGLTGAALPVEIQVSTEK
ncbi:hypothetical protein [Paenibacillus terrae]|uniref:hypothetical protein n=1 Tax=Paenibacillus terrae TaxID=159743 RepID=UPI000ACEEB4C|nr:hypothetical protein [Paenibacillus terrae]